MRLRLGVFAPVLGSALLILTASASAQIVIAAPATAPKSATVIGNLGDTPMNLHYATPDLLPAPLKERAKRAIRSGGIKVSSVPMFSINQAMGPVQSGAIFVGGVPSKGGTTSIATQVIPITLVFDGTDDPRNPGNPITLSFDQGTFNKVVNGPDFKNSTFSTGNTQFGDAVQRAEFFSMQKSNWHTTLKAPKVLTPVVIEVPSSVAGNAIAAFQQANDGNILAALDYDFLVSQLFTIAQLEKISSKDIIIPLVKNTVLYQNGNLQDCCIAGFHTAFAEVTSKSLNVFTVAYATWLDSDLANAVGHSSFADVAALSHEISELFNDPVLSNFVVPSWQFPNSNACQDNLEVGDPVEVLADALVSTPLPLNGFTYHPQNMALLQWFTQASPSTAIGGAYSYPNTSALTSPSISCP